MKYQIELSAEDLGKIGKIIDAQPHGEVSQLVARIQAQITKQDNAALEQARAEQERALNDWREGERAKIKEELAVKEGA